MSVTMTYLRQRNQSHIGVIAEFETSVPELRDILAGLMGFRRNTFMKISKEVFHTFDDTSIDTNH